MSQLPEQRRHHRAHPTPPHANTALQRRRTLCRCGASGPQHRNMRRCDARALWWFQDFSLLDHTGYTALHQVGQPACHSYSIALLQPVRRKRAFAPQGTPVGQCAAHSRRHCTARHCTAQHSTAQHSTAQHCIALHCIALHCIALHCIAMATAAVRVSPSCRRLFFAQHSTARRSTAQQPTGRVSGNHTN